MRFKNDERYFESVIGAINGNREAVNILMDIISPSVFYITYSILKNHHDAEDAAQEAIINIIQNIEKMNRPEAFETWMYKIAVNTALYMNRKAKKRMNVANEPIENCTELMEETCSEFLPQEFIEDKEKQEFLKEIVNNLSLRMRMCVKLFYYSGMSHRQIAEMTGVDEKSVENTLYRARKKIKMAIENDTHSKFPYVVHSVLPLPILAYVFQQEAAAVVTSSVIKGIVIGAEAKIAAGAVSVGAIVSGSAVASSAGAAASASVFAKVFGAVALATTLTVGSVMIVQSDRSSPPPGPNHGIEANFPKEDPDFYQEEPAPEDPPEPSPEPSPEPKKTISTLEELIGIEKAGKLRFFVNNGVAQESWDELITQISAKKQYSVQSNSYVYHVYQCWEQDKQLIMIDRTDGSGIVEVAFRFCDLSELIPSGMDVYFCFDEWRPQ